jgi:hypothetical protein
MLWPKKQNTKRKENQHEPQKKTMCSGRMDNFCSTIGNRRVIHPNKIGWLIIQEQHVGSKMHRNAMSI